MRTLERNKRSVWHAEHKGSELLKDENGLLTGERGPVYTEPRELRCNVAPPSGSSEASPFGADVAYDRALVCEDADGIDESSVLWLDSEPTDADGNAVPYDHTVIRVAESLNVAAIAVEKVR